MSDHPATTEPASTTGAYFVISPQKDGYGFHIKCVMDGCGYVMGFSFGAMPFIVRSLDLHRREMCAPALQDRAREYAAQLRASGDHAAAATVTETLRIIVGGIDDGRNCDARWETASGTHQCTLKPGHRGEHVEINNQDQGTKP